MKKLIIVALVTLGLMSANSIAIADSLTPAGTATFKNGIRIPAYTVSYYDAVNGMTISQGQCPCSYRFSVPVEQASSLKVISMDGFPDVLVPKDATVEGQIAGNGSASMLITSSQVTIKCYKSYSSSAIWDASHYFSNARKMLERDGMESDLDSPQGLRSLRKDHTTAFYSYPANGKTVHGVATFLTDTEDMTFVKEEVTVDDRYKKLATTILNFYYNQTKL